MSTDIDDEDVIDEELTAGFNATFDADTPVTAPAEEAPQPDWRAEAEKARQEAEEAKARAEKLEQAHRSLQGKYNAEVPRLQKQLEELSQRVSTPPAAPVTSDDDDVVKVFDEQYATIAEAVDRKVQRALQPLKEKAEQIEQKVTAVAQTAELTEEELHFKAIGEAHADWRTVVDSKEFDAWVKARPSYEQNAINAVLDKGTAKQVVELLSTYKGTSKVTHAPQNEPPVTAARGRPIPVGLVGEPDKADFAAGFRLASAQHR